MANSENLACVIRPADPAEALQLSELALRSKAHWGYPAGFLQACRPELTYSAEKIRDDAFSFSLAEIAGVVAGFYALGWLSHTQCELEALFVEPAWIGRGIGHALLDHAKRAASGAGASIMRIQGDPNAARFYTAGGAIQTGERESGSIPGRMLPLYEIDLCG